VRIALRGHADVAIELRPARPTPVDWASWRNAQLDGPPLAPIVEEYTVPEGWSVTIVDTAQRVHAFYHVLDHAVHASAAVSDEQRASVRLLFKEAAPIFDDEIVALVQL
jgi:hypothetical protein